MNTRLCDQFVIISTGVFERLAACLHHVENSKNAPDTKISKCIVQSRL